MPSWQARLLTLGVRALVRRRDWGDERTLVRRARRLLGAPAPYGWLATRGLSIEPVRARGIWAEWLVPKKPADGVLLYVHGGGFVSCSAARHRPITAALARFTNRRVLSVDYRLAPEHRFPAAHEDVLAAYEWLLATGVPASAIAVAGDSAGGNLALALAIRLRDRQRPAPACVVAFSPWTDLAGTGASVRENDGRCAMFHPANIADFAAAALGAAPARDPAASLVHADLGGLPPVLLHVGSTELLLDDSRRVHDAIRAAGGRSELQIFDDVAHCWQMLVPLVPEATASLRAAAAFIERHLTDNG
jgi:acetyl esterase/lipase